MIETPAVSYDRTALGYRWELELMDANKNEVDVTNQIPINC